MVAHDQLDQEGQTEGSRNMRCTMVLQQNSVPAMSFFVFANYETETFRESCIIHFLTKPPCSTRFHVHETGDVPILFYLSQMQNLGVTLELDPKGAKITCPAFGLYSSPVECSTMGHLVLDWTSLAYQPKSRERSARPTKHVTFALSQRKSAYPARAQELDDDEDDKPLVRPDRTAVSEEEDEDDKPLVQPTSALKRESSAVHRVPTPLRKRKGPPVGRDPCATPEQDVSGTSRERPEDISSLGKNSNGEALQKITNKFLDFRNLKDLHLKHYHMSSAQFKRRTTHLDFPGSVFALYQHVVNTCPFCNSTKPRPDRSRVGGLRAQEFGYLIFFDHGSTNIGDQTFEYLIVLDGETSH